MKKIFILIFAFSFSLQLIFAQKDRTASAGPIPKLRPERSHTQVNPSQRSLLETAYGHSSIQNHTLSMPIPAGTPFTLLSEWYTPYGYFASSMGMTPFDGPAYITAWTTWAGHPQQLYQMDTENGSVTFVGNIIGMGTDQPIAIAYNLIDLKFYIISLTNLYSFDVCTLVATLIGPLNAGGMMIAFCFGFNGVCYAYNLTDDNAYTINTSTGNATLLGPLGYDANGGQGMSYDYSSGTIYLSAFNNATVSGQLRTMDPATGLTTLITDWGYEQIAPFAIDHNFVGGCWSYYDPPAEPNPPTGTTGISVSGIVLNWLNSEGTQNVEIYFGPRDSITKVYDGPAITSWQTGSLHFQTDYFWHVVSKDPCAIHGPVWNFTTEAPPGVVFWEDFIDLTYWTWIGPLGQTNWTLQNSNNAGGTPPELRCYTVPTYNGLNQQLSCVINSTTGHTHEFRFKYKYYWSYDPAPAHGLAITYDGGATSTSLWEQTPFENTGPEEVVLQYTPTSDSFQLIIYNNGNSYNLWRVYYDDFLVTDLDIIPVELNSYRAEVKNNIVELKWITVTETNNQEFEIERLQHSKIEKLQNWETIGFVEGKGSTTEIQIYSFTDKPELGIYKYRLKQIDYDGTFAYSPEVEAEVKAPNVFSLEQNYPNPFNPNTVISYQLPLTGNVSLKIYDILGSEIEALVNEEKPAGTYEVTWYAEQLPSGVYFYQLIVGSFIETKKMILMK